MTKKEKEILEIIRQDPTIEQNKIAQLLGISRSTVAVHISSLQKQGYLLGKGYIVAEEDYIVGIGASNVDVYGKSRIPLREHYDHPADIVSSVGGVMHNVGQVAMAMLIFQTGQLVFYMAVLIFIGMACGALTGVCAYSVIRHMRAINIAKKSFA